MTQQTKQVDIKSDSEVEVMTVPQLHAELQLLRSCDPLLMSDAEMAYYNTVMCALDAATGEE